MTTPMAPGFMTPDRAAEMSALMDTASQYVLRDPATTAVYLDHQFHRRSHLAHLSEEMARVASGQTKRLLLMMPPQTGKSTLAAVWSPFWWLARNPTHRVIIGSYGQNLAMKRGRAIRRLVERHGWQWDLSLAWGSRTTADWQLESGGGIKSVGVGTGVTGSPADLLVLDDPHKSRAEADSRTKRDAVWDWYSADFLSRLAPDGPMIAMLTPWHEDDWAHRVLEQDGEESEGGKWRVVRLPAIADADDDVLGREPGDPLPHPLVDEDDREGALAHWHERRAQSSPRDWGALYQLDPKPVEGALLSRTLLRERRYLPPPAEPIKTAVAIDPADGGRDTAGVVGGFLGDDKRLYITHDVTLNGSAEQWARAAVLLAGEIDADFFVVETGGAFGKSSAKLVLASTWEAVKNERPGDAAFARLMPQIQVVNARKGKLLRAEPIAQQFHVDRIRFGAHLPEVENEWATWQPTDTDSPGRIDASVYLGYALLPVPGAEAVVSTATGVAMSTMGQGSGTRIQRPGPGGGRRRR